MSVIGNVPQFLRENKHKNSSGGTSGVFQFTRKNDELIWLWLATQPELFDACNSFMEGNRGSRPSWVTWFPIQERVIDGFNAAHGDTLLIDVGGGRGHEVAGFHRAFPSAPGKLYLEDLPHVINDVLDLDPAIERLPQDFFAPQAVQGTSTITAPVK